MSLNGKIARADGSFDWLDSIPNPEKSDYGYADFYNSIDTTLMGYTTYDQIVNMDIKFPYQNKTNYVLTRKQNLDNTEYVEFVSKNHIDFIRQIKQEEGNDIWLIGGGQVNTMLFNENLIDEIQVFVMPIVIPNGIELFEVIPQEKQLKLTASKSFSSGVVELNYKVEV